MKSIEFVRWGGLSAVNHKKLRKGNDGFHAPPVKRGIYVFHPDWIELFLVAWKWYRKVNKDPDDYEKERIYMKQRRFKYSGKIWTHLHHIHPSITYYKTSGSWYLTDTDCLPQLIKLEVKSMNKQLNNSDHFFATCEKDAYKYMSKDHMEFFIEKV